MYMFFLGGEGGVEMFVLFHLLLNQYLYITHWAIFAVWEKIYIRNKMRKMLGDKISDISVYSTSPEFPVTLTTPTYTECFTEVNLFLGCRTSRLVIYMVQSVGENSLSVT